MRCGGSNDLILLYYVLQKNVIRLDLTDFAMKQIFIVAHRVLTQSCFAVIPSSGV